MRRVKAVEEVKAWQECHGFFVRVGCTEFRLTHVQAMHLREVLNKSYVDVKHHGDNPYRSVRT